MKHVIDYIYGLEIASVRSRHDKLIDFINKNQGCTKEFIVNNVPMARRTIYKIVKDLIEEGIVEQKKSEKNRKEKKLFLIKTHPMLILQSDIEKFKKYFNPLFEKAISTGFKWEFEDRPRQALSLIAVSIETYLLFIQILNYRMLLEWPKQIKDEETLRRLYFKLYSEMAEIQVEMSNKFRNKANKIREQLKVNDIEDDLREALLGVTEGNFLPDEFEFQMIESEFRRFKSTKFVMPLLSFLSKMRFNIPTTAVYPSEEETKTQEWAADELERRLNPPGFHERLKKHISYSKVHRYTDKGRVTQFVPQINFDAILDEDEKNSKNKRRRRK